MRPTARHEAATGAATVTVTAGLCVFVWVPTFGGGFMPVGHMGETMTVEPEARPASCSRRLRGAMRAARVRACNHVIVAERLNGRELARPHDV